MLLSVATPAGDCKVGVVEKRKLGSLRGRGVGDALGSER